MVTSCFHHSQSQIESQQAQVAVKIWVNPWRSIFKEEVSIQAVLQFKVLNYVATIYSFPLAN